MKRIEWGDGNIAEIFNDFSDFFSTCDNREWNNEFYERARTRYAPNDDWAGANYEQAREYMLHGYEETVSKTKTAVDQLQKQSIVKKPTRTRDYVGFTPIIPNVINGYPKSMWNDRRPPLKSKVITILFDVSILCDITREQMQKKGAEVVSWVMNLERLGYRVRIDVLDGFSREWTYLVRVPIKNENNPINLKRVSFPMTHTAFSRTLGFDWYERLPGARYMSGYGRSIYALDECEREQVLEIVTDDTEYYVNYQSDLEEVFSDFKGEMM